MTNQPSTNMPHSIEDQIAENLQPDGDDVYDDYTDSCSTGPHAHFDVQKHFNERMQFMYR